MIDVNLTVQYPETPAGKRAVRANIYGNLVGYVSGRRFWEFGANEAWNKRVADEWLQGLALEQAQMGGVE